MLKTETQMVEQEVITHYICNKCGLTVEMEDNNWEDQEFFHYSFTGGYGSIFGDMFSGRIDLCQHCFKQLLGPYIKCTNECYE